MQEGALLKVGEREQEEANKALGLDDGPVALNSVVPDLAGDGGQGGRLVQLSERLATRAAA